MKFSLTITSKGKGKGFDKASSASKSALQEYLVDGALAIHKEAIDGINKVSSGERQTRYNPKRVVVASKPGDPPNVDLGTFIKSVVFNVNKSKMEAVVGTNDKRGPWFEFGTTSMSARPWLGPAIKKAKSTLKSLAKKLKIKIG